MLYRYQEDAGEDEGEGGIILDYAENKLTAAQEHLDAYLKTRKTEHKQAAQERLRAFESLVKQAREDNPDIELQNYMVHYKALMAKLASFYI